MAHLSDWEKIYNEIHLDSYMEGFYAGYKHCMEENDLGRFSLEPHSYDRYKPGDFDNDTDDS